jgi:hypothetical protein
MFEDEDDDEYENEARSEESLPRAMAISSVIAWGAGSRGRPLA